MMTYEIIEGNFGCDVICEENQANNNDLDKKNIIFEMIYEINEKNKTNGEILEYYNKKLKTLYGRIIIY